MTRIIYEPVALAQDIINSKQISLCISEVNLKHYGFLVYVYEYFKISLISQEHICIFCGL